MKPKLRPDSMSGLNKTRSVPGEQKVVTVETADEDEEKLHLHGEDWHCDLLMFREPISISAMAIENGADIRSAQNSILANTGGRQASAVVDNEFKDIFKEKGFCVMSTMKCVSGELIHGMRTGQRDRKRVLSYCTGCNLQWSSTVPVAMTT